MKAGPTGRLNDHDRGELAISVKRDPASGLVIVNFEVPVTWIGLPPDGAIAFAEALIRHAELEKEELN